MDQKTFQDLEYQTVLDWLAESAHSPLGAELLRELRPFDDPQQLRQEELRLAEATRLLERNEVPPLGGLHDPRPLLERLRPEGAALEPGELLKLANFCEVAARLAAFFAECAAVAPLLAKIAEGLTPLPELEQEIRRCIEPSGEIADHASPQIAELRGEIQRQEQRLQQSLEKLVAALSRSGDLQDAYYTQRNGRYVLPLKAGSKGRAPGIVHDVSGSGETFFVEPFELVERSNALTGLHARLREEIRRVLLALSGRARMQLVFLEENRVRLARFDSLLTRARFGWQLGWQAYCNENEIAAFELLHAQHPILHRNLGAGSIALDLALKPGDRAVIVSGPNAGGKTTLLKTIGLLVLLRQSVIPIPAAPGTELPFFSRVFADIGDEQSIIRGVSTFSSHVRRLAAIVARADAGTLILLDELGAATDPQEGAALAIALLEKLEAAGATVFATSHLTALKQWAHERPAARNCSFYLDRATQRPAFKPQLDVPGASEALIVAEQQGLDAELIARAKELLPAGAADLSRLLGEIELKQSELNRRIAETEAAQTELLQEREQWRQRAERLRERQLTLDAEFARERERWLLEVKAALETKIAGLSQKSELRETRDELQAQLDKTRREREELARAKVERAGGAERLKPGARVKALDFSSEGRLIAVNFERNRATVAIGNFNAEVELSKLAVLEDNEATSPPPPQAAGRVLVRAASNVHTPLKIDLHGMRVEPALHELENYLSAALLRGYPQVTIVHGHGTGRLAAAIHDRLRTHPQVRRFRFGNPGEGGGAVTLVEFKE